MGKYNTEQIEKYLKQLKLDALAQKWATVPFTTKEQYIPHDKAPC